MGLVTPEVNYHAATHESIRRLSLTKINLERMAMRLAVLYVACKIWELETDAAGTAVSGLGNLEVVEVRDSIAWGTLLTRALAGRHYVAWGFQEAELAHLDAANGAVLKVVATIHGTILRIS